MLLKTKDSKGLKRNGLRYDFVYNVYGCRKCKMRKRKGRTDYLKKKIKNSYIRINTIRRYLIMIYWLRWATTLTTMSLTSIQLPS